MLVINVIENDVQNIQIAFNQNLITKPNLIVTYIESLMKLLIDTFFVNIIMLAMSKLN